MCEFRIMATIDWTKYDISEARQIAKKFGSAVVQKWTAKLQDLDLVDKGNLLRSLKFSVRAKGIEIDRIEFSYDFYGKIWENGATNVFGKGLSLKPRPWRNEVLEELKPELDQEFGEFYAAMIINELFIESVTLKM